MKLARWLLLGLGLVVLLAVALTAVALLPPVQKWAVLRAVNSQPGLRLSADSLSAGLSSFQADKVEFASGGIAVKADRIVGDYALWSLLVSQRVRVGRLVVRGASLDLRRLPAAPAAPVASSAAFPVDFTGWQLPLEVSLETCEIEGRALVPGASGHPALQVEYKITGGKFGPGRDAAFQLNAKVADSSAGARVTALHVSAGLQLAQTPQRTFSSLGLNALVDAEGPVLSGKNQLRIEAKLAQTADDKFYLAKIDTIANGRAENVLELRAGLPPDGKAFAGTWVLKASRAQVEPFFLGGALPEFGCYGNGRFTLEPGARRGRLRGHISGVADQLGALAPSLQALGAVSLQADFDLAQTGGVTRLEKLDLVMSGARPALEARSRRVVEFDAAGRAFHFDGGVGEVFSLKLLGVPAVWLRPLLAAAEITDGSLTGELSIFSEGENLRAQSPAPLKLVGLEASRAGQPLLNKADVSFHFDALLARDKLQASVRDFRLQTAAGDTVSAQAEVTVPAGNAPPIALKTRLDADLPGLLASVVPLDRVRIRGEADVTLQEARVDVRVLTADVTAGGAPMFTASALQPFSIDFAKRRATPSKVAAPDLLRVVLGRLPLQPFSTALHGLLLDGQVTQGEFTLSTEGEKLLLQNTVPLQLAGFTLARPGQPLLSQVAIEASPSVELSPAGTKVRTGELALRSAADAALLTAQTEINRTAAETRINSSFRLDLPALGAQPLFAGAAAVTQGRASGEVHALFGGGTAQVEAHTTLNGLVAKDSGQPLPIANLSLRAVLTPDGAVSVQAPLLLDRSGQRSDLNLAAEAKPVAGGYSLEAKLTGSHVEAEDARVLVGVFLPAAPPSSAPAPVPAASAPDRLPAWNGLVGQLQLDLKSVTYGKGWTMGGLTGVVKVESARLTLQQLAATFDEQSHLEAKGEVRFNGAAARPYQLTGDFSLTEFDAGRLFRALEATKAPTIEGLFTVKGSVLGEGATFADLPDHTRGQFDLTSRKGVARILQRATSKVSTASKAVQLGAALGALLGSSSVAKTAEKVVGGAYLVDELAASLGEFAYDQLSVKLSRDESLNMKLENVSLIAPEVRLVGHGQVTYTAGTPLLEQPLNVELALTSRGKIEQLLGKLGALDGTRDDLGYARMKFPVTIAGTLDKPDPGKFYAAFATSSLLNLLDR